MPVAPRWCSGRSLFLSLIGMVDDTLSLDNFPLCFAARVWFGSGIMLLGFTDAGEVRSFEASGEAEPSSLGVHAFPLAMRANSTFASSCVMGTFDALLPEPQPNHPIAAGARSLTRARVCGHGTRVSSPLLAGLTALTLRGKFNVVVRS